MLYEDFNTVDPTRATKLKESAIRYIEAMSGSLGQNDPDTKAELLKEWYAEMCLVGVNPQEIHHALYGREPEMLMLLSLLILRIELHKIASKIAEELGFVFPEDLTVGGSRTETEAALRALLENIK
jgi:hypothetical protein